MRNYFLAGREMRPAKPFEPREMPFRHRRLGFGRGAREREQFCNSSHKPTPTYVFCKAHHANAFLGSNASRTASPMKISSESMTATAKNPVSPSQGACTLALPWDSSSPSEGEPGGSPKPRKSSAVRVITEEERMNGRNVMVPTMALGNRCRNMIFGLETPSARAACTYSKLRPRRNSARTRPTSDTQENSSKIPSSTKKPGTSTEEMISSR